MIDLERTRAELLSEIGAPVFSGAPLTDLTDTRVLASDVRLLLRGHTRADLFPLLEVVLSERFAAVPRPRAIRDLLVPLKSALGNAHKRGNRGDSTKSISVETVLTPKGALVAVSDEGEGFDVGRVVRHLRSRERYFTDYGHGFRTFDQAASLVTYENGGRTLLLRFLAAVENPERSSPVATYEENALGKAADAEWMHSCLSAELLELPGKARLQSSRAAWVANGSGGHDRDLRYVLQVGGDDARPTEVRILTGRLHATADSAAADFDAATRLHDGLGSARVRIPRPIARLAGEPRLVLYDFDPWMNLAEYVADRENPPLSWRRAERVGQSLATLHGSRIAFRQAAPELLDERYRRTCERLFADLATRYPEADFSSRLESVLRSIAARASAVRSSPPAPIHGRFGLDCVQYGVDGRFYLYRFEDCRMSDPGLDLGGFLADLLLLGDEETRRAGSEGFLAGYSSKLRRATAPADLGLYVALALLERLARPKPRTGPEVESLLRHCERSLERAG